MRRNLKTHLFAVTCASVLFASSPSGAAVLSTTADLNVDGASASSFIQKTTLHAPAGRKCIKWTRNGIRGTELRDADVSNGDRKYIGLGVSGRLISIVGRNQPSLSGETDKQRGPTGPLFNISTRTF